MGSDEHGRGTREDVQIQDVYKDLGKSSRLEYDRTSSTVDIGAVKYAEHAGLVHPVSWNLGLPSLVIVCCSWCLSCYQKGNFNLTQLFEIETRVGSRRS